jgi:exosortase/archaeosortase family protein
MLVDNSKTSKIQQVIPPQIKSFLLKAVLLIIGWSLLYHLLLKPTGVPDTQLTYLVQRGSGFILSFFYDSITYENNILIVDGVQCVSIAPQCNGLELIVLYIGFLLCFPINWKRFSLFALGGIIGIYILNILRCSALAVMMYNDHPMANFAHHYAFKMVVYAFVFAGWIFYTKKNKA